MMHDDSSRDRVTNAVLSRIASAPRVERTTGILDGYARLAQPLFAAAAVIIVVSAIAFATAGRPAAEASTVEGALGLAPPVARYVATHAVEPWSLITGYRKQP